MLNHLTDIVGHSFINVNNFLLTSHQSLRSCQQFDGLAFKRTDRYLVIFFLWILCQHTETVKEMFGLIAKLQINKRHKRHMNTVLTSRFTLLYVTVNFINSWISYTINLPTNHQHLLFSYQMLEKSWVPRNVICWQCVRLFVPAPFSFLTSSGT